jgi:hypothetical protein
MAHADAQQWRGNLEPNRSTSAASCLFRHNILQGMSFVAPASLAPALFSQPERQNNPGLLTALCQ